MTDIKIGDYVIRADNSHDAIGKVSKLDGSNYSYPIRVQWLRPGYSFPDHCKVNQLIVITKEDNPEYFI
jgi:hypothetical protein